MASEKRMTIAVDFDDVLFPYHHYLKRNLHRRHGLDLRRRHVTTFFYHQLNEARKLGLSERDIWDVVRDTWHDAQAHNEASLVHPEIPWIVASLRGKHRVVVVSARDDDTRPLVDAFLRRHAIEVDDVLLGQLAKHGYDVLIDDFPKHVIENAEAGGRSILFHIDENSDFDESVVPGATRIRSWSQVADAVSQIEVEYARA